MGKYYTNAADVLPEDLLKEVRKYCTGMLYVAGEDTRSKKRQLIINLARQNVSTAEIAMIAGVSRRRINQIIAGKRRQTWEWIG